MARSLLEDDYGDRTYWHVVIYRSGSKYTMRRRKGEKTIDLTQFALPEDL